MKSDEEADENSDDSTPLLTLFRKPFTLSPNRPDSTADELAKSSIIQISSGSAAEFLACPFRLEILASRATGSQCGLPWQESDRKRRLKPQAMHFINEFLGPERARCMFYQGVVQASLDGDDRILPMQKARFTSHEIPLDRIRFPSF